MCNYHLKYLELRVDYIYIAWTEETDRQTYMCNLAQGATPRILSRARRMDGLDNSITLSTVKISC